MPNTSKLESFARQALQILEADKEWSSATLDDIQAAAYNLGLATSETDDETGETLFKATPPVSS